MATLTTTGRNAAANAVAALLNSGLIKIYTSGATLLATLTFSSTAFGSASTGVCTANSITSDTDVDATGTADNYKLQTSGAADIFTGAIADLGFNTASFIQHGTAAMSSLTITQPAS